MSKLNERPVLNIALGALCIAAIVVAYTTVGEASQSSAQSTRTATVQQGVVQSTVSGSGNIQAASQLNLGFKTSGTVTHIYVHEGQQVAKGQLLATLEPQSAEVTLEQAKASLQSAEASLASEEENNGESSSTQSAGGSGTGTKASTASIAYTTNARGPAAPTATTTPTQTTTPPTTTPSTTTTAPATTPTTTTTTPSSKSPTTTTKSPSTTTKKSQTTTPKTSQASSGGSNQGSSSSSSGASVSSATREANLASAKAAVKSDKLTVQSDEQAVQNTKLYAPQDGTIVTLSGEVGETVSATGTTKASSASSSSSSGAATGSTGSSSSPNASGGSSESSKSSSGSSFAVLSDLSSMQLVVPLSESEIGNVKVGQTATVTIEALGSRKVAAHVLGVDALSTSNSGVVSYDVTFQLDHRNLDYQRREAERRLVEQDELRARHQRPGDREHLLLAAAHAAGLLVAPLLQPGEGRVPTVDVGRDLAVAAQVRADAQVLVDGEVDDRAAALRDVRDARPRDLLGRRPAIDGRRT